MKIEELKLPYTDEKDVPSCYQVAALRTIASYLPADDETLWDEFIARVRKLIMERYTGTVSDTYDGKADHHFHTETKLDEWLRDELDIFRGVNLPLAEDAVPFSLSERFEWGLLRDAFVDAMEAWQADKENLDKFYAALTIEQEVADFIRTVKDRSIVVEQWFIFMSTEFLTAALSRAETTSDDIEQARREVLIEDPDFEWEEFAYTHNFLLDN